MLDVALLGTGGMMPLPGRFLTSLLCRLNGHLAMVDCGEGTQISLKMLGWGFKNIDVICFTHYHADHIAGLPGMLLTIGNSNRTEPLTLIGPTGLVDVVNGLRKIAPELPFEIICKEIPLDPSATAEDMTFHMPDYTIQACFASHVIPCVAYHFSVDRIGKFDIQKAKALPIPVQMWSALQKQNDVEYEGKIYTSDMVLGETRKGIKVSYCTDSRPTDKLVSFVHQSDLFICEGMYGEDEKLSKAVENKHMIFSEAARMAKQAGAKQLWLTHFSPSLTNPEQFVDVAGNIFPNTVVAYDRITTSVFFE